MFKSWVQGLTSLASLSPSASIQVGGGLKCSPHAAGAQLMQAKKANMTEVQLEMMHLEYLSVHVMGVIGQQLEIHHLS